MFLLSPKKIEDFINQTKNLVQITNFCKKQFQANIRILRITSLTNTKE
ncbi:unnamed protein product [Paramecium octaurelia]|uniref:Uncharacterized protein n=1 Tax=Paramecium octaurelia TaxID=43137 RepID=A0A8S1WZV8_PAROT|nr:unnamed protein product [Paramecium octaurelia]